MTSNNDLDDQQKEVSRFNEAGLQIMRLNELWTRAELYANAGIVIKWKFILDSIWRELYPDVLRMSNSKKIMVENADLKLATSQPKTKNAFYFWLDKRHEFLKELQDKAGKGGAYEYSGSQDFD